MAFVRLSEFRNDWYKPGRSLFWQCAWFFLGLPLLRSALIPSSAFRCFLLRFFGATLGPGVVIKPGVRIKYPWRFTAGADTWLGEDCWIDNLADVQLGSSVCLSQGTYLCTGNHDWTDPAFGLIVKPIRIDDGAWVGARSVVCPGIAIGAGAVAAAGSIVNRNIPPMEIHGGNPAVFLKRRVIRERTMLTPEETWSDRICTQNESPQQV
jgi:putative colanic acid biosynthesis acetyltransferase WcaF